MKTPRSPSLDRERILDAAIAIADSEGIAAVTLRRVAQRLSTGAMSLYRHIDGKDALLDGLTERVCAEVLLPAENSSWREGLHARAVAIRQVCLRHPWAARLMEERLACGPARLRMQDRALGLLMGAGFAVPLACSAVTTLDSYIYGFTLRETALPPAGDLEGVVGGIVPTIHPEDYPHIVIGMMHAMQKATEVGGAGPIMEEDFLFGLGLILDGIAGYQG